MNGLPLFLVSTMLCWLICFPVHRLLVHFGVIDRPNERSSHATPTARGGGVAIGLSILAMAMFVGSVDIASKPVGLTLLIAALVLAIVSFIDDLRSLPAILRLSIQIAAALAILWQAAWPAPDLHLAAGVLLKVPTGIGIGVALLWLVGYTNAFNFMDGINGIAGLQGAISSIGLALLAKGTPEAAGTGQLAWILGGACLGFIPHNFPKARMFMGDVGSAPLGLLLATSVLWLGLVSDWTLLIPAMLLHTNFILDTGVTLVRRMLRGERPHQAHREHCYQRLVRSGKSHTAVTTITALIQIGVLVLVLLYPHADVVGRITIIAASLTVWLAYYAWGEKRSLLITTAKPLSRP